MNQSDLKAKVLESLQAIESDPHSFAILELDNQLFCKSSFNRENLKEAIQALADIFSDEQFQETAKQTNAGILLEDLLRLCAQKQLLFERDILPDTLLELFNLQVQKKVTRKVLARILGMIILARILQGSNELQMAQSADTFSNAEEMQAQMSEKLQELLEPILENKLQSEDSADVDLAMRTLHILLNLMEDANKSVQPLVIALLMPSLFEAFTNSDSSSSFQQLMRAKILFLFYKMVRMIAWADGIDNQLVQGCLDETFQSWMALFLQIIQTTSSSKNTVIKRCALQCLTVIFRDLINYSRSSIQMILRPAWKLMNQTLPLYSEVEGYGSKIEEQEQVEQQSDDDCECASQTSLIAEIDEEDLEQEQNLSSTAYQSNQSLNDCGLGSLTFHLLELLSTLVQRPAVQQLVAQGLVPLMTTVCSYLIVPRHSEHVCRFEPTYFTIERQEMLRSDSVRSLCLVLVSNLIEIYGDDAIQALLFFIQNIFIKQGSNKQQQPGAQSDTKTKSTNDNQNQSHLQQQDSSDKETDQLADQLRQKNQMNNQENFDFAQLLSEHIYTSSNIRHPFKTTEAGLLLLGIFAEDIAMYTIRSNPDFSLQIILEDVAKSNFTEISYKSLRNLCIGRSLWSAEKMVDAMEGGLSIDFIQTVLANTSVVICDPNQVVSVKLIAVRSMMKLLRKMPRQAIANGEMQHFLEPTSSLLDQLPIEVMHVPIEALATIARLSDQAVAANGIAQSITPKLIDLFKNQCFLAGESQLGSQLISLFKLWCRYEGCLQMFVQEFGHQIKEIIDLYYKQTQGLTSSAQGSQVIDQSIFTHSCELLCTMLRYASKSEQKLSLAKAILPSLIEYMNESVDMFLIMQGTTCLKQFLSVAHEEVLQVVKSDQLLSLTKQKLLSPKTNEQAAVCLGNMVIQLITKVQPKIDTSLLMNVVEKIYKSRMPSIVQSLVLIFARLIQTNPKQIIQFLSETSIDNRICLKIVLDKWLLQQPLFRGCYTRTVTLSSLLKIFCMRDPCIEQLMVIGYNPSHSNVNSEVNAPFKILSIILRFIHNENKPTKQKQVRGTPSMPDDEEVKASGGATGAFAGYSMTKATNKGRKANKPNYDDQELDVDSGARMDTLGGGTDEDNFSDNDSFGAEFGNLQDDDRLSVEIDDVQSGSDDDNNERIMADKLFDSSKEQLNDQKELSSDAQAIEDPILRALKMSQNTSLEAKSTGSSGENSAEGQKGDSGEQKMFEVGKSKDKGLADIETGSEVYMSELLAGFDMEDFDEADEANEEDLLLLKDDFADVKILVQHIQERLNQFVCTEEQGSQYMYYCAKQLPKDDIKLASKLINFPKGVPQLLD